ncbi:hypothetical protein [Geminisphaera colitermitum]|uniref:hypothetical protein n=1 Tax=Geminisphaera colitermitum TaxID=1148786 RepID=UPI000158C978|nr:hypothetical protein [Geminisphaera colitermitum]
MDIETENTKPPVITDATNLAADALARAPKATTTVDGKPVSSAPTGASEQSEASAHRLDELDSLGRKFDPKKFRPEKDKIGRWKNQKGGRPRKTGDTANAGGSPAQTTAQTTVSAPESDLFIPKGNGAAPGQEPGETATETASGTEPGKTDDGQTPEARELAAKKTAESVCRLTYAGLGFVTGHPEETTPTPAEHKALVDGTSAYLMRKGWVATGLVLLLMLWGLYVETTAQKPGVSAKLASWWKSWFGKKPKPVAAAAPPRTVSANTATATPATPHVDPSSSPVAVPSEHAPRTPEVPAQFRNTGNPVF